MYESSWTVLSRMEAINTRGLVARTVDLLNMDPAVGANRSKIQRGIKSKHIGRATSL